MSGQWLIFLHQQVLILLVDQQASMFNFPYHENLFFHCLHLDFLLFSFFKTSWSDSRIIARLVYIYILLSSEDISALELELDGAIGDFRGASSSGIIGAFFCTSITQEVSRIFFFSFQFQEAFSLKTTCRLTINFLVSTNMHFSLFSSNHVLFS
jgi:hypothetical protein